MEELKRLRKFLIILAAMLGAVVSLLLALPITSIYIGQAVGLIGVAIAIITAFVKFLQDMDRILDEAETNG